jgi:hypothetical protein
LISFKKKRDSIEDINSQMNIRKVLSFQQKKDSDMKFVTKHLNEVSISEDCDSEESSEESSEGKERAVKITDSWFGRVNVMKPKKNYKNNNSYCFRNLEKVSNES